MKKGTYFPITDQQRKWMRHNVATQGRRNIKDLRRARQSQTLLHCSMWIKVARLQRHLSPEKACNEVPHRVREPHCPHIHALTHTHVHDKWPRAAKPLHANACLVCVCVWPSASICIRRAASVPAPRCVLLSTLPAMFGVRASGILIRTLFYFQGLKAVQWSVSKGNPSPCA